MNTYPALIMQPIFASVSRLAHPILGWEQHDSTGAALALMGDGDEALVHVFYVPCDNRSSHETGDSSTSTAFAPKANESTSLRVALLKPSSTEPCGAEVIALCPSGDPRGYDALGLFNPHVSRRGETLYLIYCTAYQGLHHFLRRRLGMAVSRDGRHWEKLPLLQGAPNQNDNMGGLLIPPHNDGVWRLLHQPVPEGSLATAAPVYLAETASPLSEWQDARPFFSMEELPVAVSLPIRGADEADALTLIYRSPDAVRGEMFRVAEWEPGEMQLTPYASLAWPGAHAVYAPLAAYVYDRWLYIVCRDETSQLAIARVAFNALRNAWEEMQS